MKPQASILLAIGGLAVIVGCKRDDASGSASASADSVEIPATLQSASSTGQDHLRLNDAQLAELTLAALDGDAVAAERVAVHFAESALDDPNHAEDATYWFSIAAENGNTAAMVIKAKQLYETGGRGNCRRAMFWLARAESAAENEDTRANARSWKDAVSANTDRCRK